MSRRPLLASALAVALVVAGIGVTATWQRDDEPAPQRRSSPTTAAVTTTTGLVGQPGASGVGDGYFPLLGNGGYDVAHYNLALAWAPDTGSITGTATIEALATQDLSRFDLDLVGLDVASVTVDGVAAAVARHDRELEITPIAVIPRAARFITVVQYSGVPERVGDGTDLFDAGWQVAGREAYVLSEPSGAATFFPVNDHPVDKATYSFAVTAPADQVVVTNGLLVDHHEVPGGQQQWDYEARDPMASYLVQIAIGDFELIDGGRAGDVVIRHAFHRGATTAAKAVAGRSAEMIDVLDDVFGPFPFEVYGVLVVKGRLRVALETQTLTIIGTDVGTTRAGAERVLVHELAHQWAGNAVSASTWQDIWLNEGFATYAEWLWVERTGGPSAAASARANASRRDLGPPPGDPGPTELFSRTVYLRGAMTLQALREAIGGDAFFTVLRTWIEEHRYDVASTTDFVALAERVSGRQLDGLFLRWLYSPGLPSLP
ncbi:MAG: M1 family metallopeptidase [Acidimicrobiales bacterium]